MLQSINILALLAPKSSKNNLPLIEYDNGHPWFYCSHCQVGFDTQKRHEWHLSICKKVKSKWRRLTDF
ncbi:hypothetical protein BDB01DRAFT_774427 [Pilobolus umbonatus]|nr:hypothetical protein BDB01DRAFT_774427 [Pilobolus umbonatus]